MPSSELSQPRELARARPSQVSGSWKPLGPFCLPPHPVWSHRPCFSIQLSALGLDSITAGTSSCARWLLAGLGQREHRASAGAPGGGAGAGTFIPPLPCVGVAVGCCVPWLKVTAPDRQPSPELLGTTPSPDAADLRAGEGSRWVLHNPGVSPHTLPTAL